ncbi:hypothetical protein R1flu_028522 [Riccia fluitans]|uniref:Phospholipase A-2-activating protein n=1 Tax=Riccia fluitans TaxID=41844 RepID=A0ABD1XLX6_9MARC
MTKDGQQYKLRCQLQGHVDDVRGLCICGDSAIATGSRDKTVRIWSPTDDENGTYTLCTTLLGHSSFVGPVAWISPSEEFPAGGLVSGGMDTRVIVWDLGTSSAVQDLRGHELQVTSVAVTDNGDVISASVDSTVRRWRKGETLDILKGHTGPVQAVLMLPTGEIVSCSSDTTIKLWKGADCRKTLSGHTDTVRGLALMPSVGILSASHDGTIRLWAYTGEQLLEMVGHTAIVYSVAAHSSGIVASGSEDRYAKLWKGGECVQSIPHPGCVWDVKFLPNGDLVTACSDGVARIWTCDSNRCATSVELEAYESLLLAHESEKKTVGGVKFSDLPGLEALQQPGTKDGQTKIVREGDSGVAYSWNKNEYKWDKIGEVIDGPDDSLEKKTLLGVTYDYVFDVDIGDGLPTRKLPYNRGQNPYDVADRWLLNEDLPLGYRQQVVEFLLQNTGQQTQMQLDSKYVDPYTGANAYVPQQPGWSVPQISATAQTPTHVLKHLPKRGMLLFDTAQYEGIYKKLVEFNTAVSADEATKTSGLTEGELMRIQAVLSILKDTPHYHASTFAEADFALISKVLLRWPVSNIFPGLDVLRMLLLHPNAAEHYAKDSSMGKDTLIGALRRANAVPVSAANQLTSARVAVNAFRHSILRVWAKKYREEVLDLFSECYQSSNKNVRLALSTLLLNYSVLLVELKDEEGQTQAISGALEMASSTEGDEEVRFRALVALGTIIHGGQVKDIVRDLGIDDIALAAAKSSVTKISEVGKDIQFLLK